MALTTFAGFTPAICASSSSSERQIKSKATFCSLAFSLFVASDQGCG
jgi:hypothetical protein